jgi:hypothetical protein|tara:strand:- start:516 stop:722 length:207 start_codon:yes stop_codon:yes gene_type:complete
MPDVTVSFTDAQWARVVAASSRIKALHETGDVDATYLAAMLKTRIQKFVLLYEKDTAHKSADSDLDAF